MMDARLYPCGTRMGQDGVVTGLRSWADVSRSLRAAHGLAQEDWAATLDVSRKTVQRWERGVGAPDDRVERLLESFCEQREVFARVGRGGLDVGIDDWAELVDVLARSRRGRAPRRTAAGSVESTLIGRDADLATLEQLLVSHRLVTITGPGGVGKTALAKAMLRRTSEDALLVELGRVNNADLVLAEVASRVGAVEAGGTSLRDSVVRAIAPGPLLLVLDNMEHLPQAVPMVGDLLASCPLLTVLATSRTPLRLSAEVEHWLAPLATDAVTSAAVALFAARALQADPGFVDGDEERALMREICVRLDGVPLAIELAAARLRAVALRDVHARIDRSLPLLSGGRRDLPARHQSMRNSLAWSHDLLEPAERHTLQRMSWFRGGFTLDAADAMADAPAFADVVGLVDAGLVTRQVSRYAMLETVREFAIEQSSAQERDDDATRFVQWATDVGRDLAGRMRGDGQGDALELFDVELPNLRAALQCSLDRSDGTGAHELAGAVAGLWDGRSMLTEARRWLELTVGCPGAPPLGRATVLNWLAYFAALQRDLPVAARHASTALKIWMEHGIPLGAGYARLVLGRVAAEQGDHAAALDELSNAERSMREGGDRWGLARLVNALGELAREMGDLEVAAARHHEALAICRELGDEASQPSILADIAHVALDRGDPNSATPAAEEALEIASRLGNGAGIAASLDALARCRLAAGDAAIAVELWDEADALRLELHHPIERRDRDALDRDRRKARADLEPETASRRVVDL